MTRLPAKRVKLTLVRSAPNANLRTVRTTSALGHLQTWLRGRCRSALPSKPDIGVGGRQVRFGPSAEVALSACRRVVGTMAATVTRAARLAAILLRIARGLRPA